MDKNLKGAPHSVFGKVIKLNAPKGEKVFVAVGTSKIESWCESDTPFVIPLITLAQFDEYGFDEKDYNMCQGLRVGEVAD